jgi:hypothetical protein
MDAAKVRSLLSRSNRVIEEFDKLSQTPACEPGVFHGEWARAYKTYQQWLVDTGIPSVELAREIVAALGESSNES